MKVKLATSTSANTDMKTAVPNSSSGKGSIQSFSGAMKVKDAGNKLIEKELEEVNMQLKGMMRTTSNNGKKCAKTNLTKAGNELTLWEQKILLMLKLKQSTNVTEEGYKILGKKGPSIIIYKCILVSLCRLGKFDDVVELLDQWKRSCPKCPQMMDTKQKMEGYLTAIRSGVDVNKLLLNIEDVIKATDSGLGSSSDAICMEPSWKYRPPPQRHNTFSLCPRSASGITCLYGNECLSAHSKEELKEWQQRTLWKNNKLVNGDYSGNVFTSSTMPAQLPLQKSMSKEQIPISYRILPPACMYYLAGLVKRVSETKNLKTLFTDGLPDVKIKLSTAASITKRLGPKPALTSHKWSFMIASKRPLATVTLLHDVTRDRFAITGAFFFNSKQATLDLVDLHPNNKSQKGIQVLNTFIRPEIFLPFNNGWPDWCCYQVVVLFQTFNQLPGKFEQDIIFDFKNDPKISKRLSVTLEPPLQKIEVTKSEVVEVKPKTSTSSFSSEETSLERDFRNTVLLNIPPRQNNIMSSTNKSNPNSSIESGSLSQSSSNSEENLDEEFRSNNINNFNIKPTLSNGQIVKKESEPSTTFKSNANSCEVLTKSAPDNVRFEEVDAAAGVLVRKRVNVNGTEASLCPLEDLADEPLTQENYASWMNLFLQCDVKARERELQKLSVKSEIDIFTAANIGMNTSLSVGLFGKLFLAKDMNEDYKIGRLVFNNCLSISIGEVEGPVISKPMTYICRVINKTEQAIIILIGRQAVEALKLCSGTTRKLDIWLHLDHTYLDLLKAVLQGITVYHLKLLFPTFPENQPWDFNSLVHSSRSRYELDETLNSKQRDAFLAIVGANKSDDKPSNMVHVPILVTGPPGSGKSYIIARSIMSIINSETCLQFPSLSRILICTYTNKAADEYITEHFSSWLPQSNRSMGDSFLLRIYHTDQMALDVSSAVKKYCLLVNDDTSFRYPTVDELLSYTIIIVTVSTCLELLQIGLPDCIFSKIFIDECHRMIEAESLCPILLAGNTTQIVVSGDMKLLNPETFALQKLNSKCKEVTLVERLNNLYPTRHPFRIRLDETYNINQDIVQFISNEFYSSTIKCAKSPEDHLGYNALTFSIVQGGEDCQPDHGDGYYNMKEMYEIRDRLAELIRAWPKCWGSYKEHAIAVITPYPDQALGLRIKLKLEGLSFVDVEALPNVLSKRYRVVLLSPVRTFRNEDPKHIGESDTDADCGLFTNPKAIYTAITRAQNLIIVVGDLVGLCNVGVCKDIWRQFVSVCRKNNSLLGLPGTFDSYGYQGRPSEKSNALVSPITRPTPIMTSSSQILKKSELFSSSPNLDSVTRNSEPFHPPSSHLSSDDTSGSLQKFRTLSSIWNTPDTSWTPMSSPTPQPLPSTLDKGMPNKSIFSNIWGDSPNTGSLGNLADPSSIWGRSTDSQIHRNDGPLKLSMDRIPNGDIYGTNKINNNISTTTSSNNYSKPATSSSSINEDSVYKTHFNLPDMRLMTEGCGKVGSSANNALILNRNNPSISTGPPGLPYHTVLQNQQQSKLNVPELLSLPNPFNLCPSPTHTNSSNIWPKAPELNHSHMPISSSSAVGLGLNISSQNQTLTNNTVHGQEPLFRTCTSFEIAQAHYAYYHHGPPRRLGYNPPPRMLRTHKPLGLYQLTPFGNQPESEFANFNSSTAEFVKDSPKNFDFFKELGLNSTPTIERKLSTSSTTSSSSQDQDNIDMESEHEKHDKKFMLNSSEFPDLGKSSANTATGITTTMTTTTATATTGAGWIEVRNTKKGKKDQQQCQKKKTKKKSLTTISMSTVPFGKSEENKVMSVDEMIESLKEMGFDKRQAIKALQICNRDLERAVEYLIQYSTTSFKKE